MTVSVTLKMNVWVGQFLLHTLDYTPLTPDYFSILPVFTIHFYITTFSFIATLLYRTTNFNTLQALLCKGEFEFFAVGERVKVLGCSARGVSPALYG